MADEVGPEGREPGRAIARRDFEQVIRRAAELAARDGDADEAIAEDEVVRIAQELGLEPHHVQRALYELPELHAAPEWYDGWFDPAIFSVSRVVPGRADPAVRRLQDYLVTREYLQPIRRRGDSIAFVPAEDTISSLSRAFSRPGSRHAVARASRLVMNVQPLPDDRSHIRFDVDLGQARRESLKSGLIIGGVGGTVLGTVMAAVASGLVPTALGPVPELLAFGGTLAGTMAGSIAAAAARFRKRVSTAKLELAALLDRVEHSESLDPPPAPWRRKLQLRLFGR
jgi:hypothetical protein